MKKKKEMQHESDETVAAHRVWETGFCFDMKVSNHVPPRDPNCMQSNMAGRLPKSGGYYCAEKLIFCQLLMYETFCMCGAATQDSLLDSLHHHFSAADRYCFHPAITCAQLSAAP